MAITTEMIKQLREATGAGILDCRKALENANGDYQKAIDAGNAILAIDPSNAYGQMAISEAQRLLKANNGKGSSASGSKPSGTTGSGGSPDSPKL